MARDDVYREWNALQELRIRLVDLLGVEAASVYEARLDQILKPEEEGTDLNQAVLRAWRSLEDSQELIHFLRASLGYDDFACSFRLESLPGPETPIHPGLLYCCPNPGCGRSLFQLFEGQRLTCPKCKVEMVLSSKDKEPKP